MIDATQYPSVQRILGDAETGREIYMWSKASVAALAAELRSLLTSNAVNAKLAAEWEAKYEALKAQQPKAPERKLREVRVRGDGFTHAVTFDGKEFVFNNANGSKRKYMTLSDMAIYHNVVSWTDDVLAQCLALKSDPFEPVEMVEAVVDDMVNVLGATNIILPEYRAEVITQLRAAFAAEQGGAE